MNNIKERAKRLAFIQGGISDYGKKVIEKCCIKIATDQQKIDIEKAWNVLFNHFNSDLPFDKEWFYKAMEE